MSEERPLRVGGGVAALSAQPHRATPRLDPPSHGRPGPAEVNGSAKRDQVNTFTGKLTRGQNDGEVRGWFFNHHTGERIEFTGCRDPRGDGYLIIGRRIPV